MPEQQENQTEVFHLKAPFKPTGDQPQACLLYTSVTFYNSTGAKLEGGLELLNANSRLTAEIARISGVVPQVAVVTGTCAGTSAVQAAAADVCIMAADAELFLTAPFNAEDKVKACLLYTSQPPFSVYSPAYRCGLAESSP